MLLAKEKTQNEPESSQNVNTIVKIDQYDHRLSKNSVRLTVSHFFKNV